MLKPLAIAILWAWTGFVSCDDPDRIAAAVRTAAAEPEADVSCREPRIWHSEETWACKAYLRGAPRCFEVRDLEQRPWEVTCVPEDPNAGKIVLPGANP